MASAKETARQMGWEIPDDETLRSFIGPPLVDSFIRAFGVNEEEAEKAADLYKRIYDETGAVHQASVYPGITEALRKMRSAGVRTAIGSAKRLPLLSEMLSMYGGDGLIEVCEGAPAEGGRAEKTKIVRTAAERLGLRPEQCLMVGDTDYDANAAGDLGMPFCGVTWGYGFRNPEDVESALPGSQTAESAEDLVRLVLGPGA